MTEPDVLSPKQARGCALVAALILGAALAALALCGCTTYTVLPADREVVPVAPLENGERKTENGTPQGRRVYVEMEDGATGWFVPDPIMLELLEAE